MANIKSAKKRILTSAKRAERNKAVKSAVKTAVKKVDAAIAAGDKAAAEESFRKAERALTMAASKGVLHKNTSSRKVSRRLIAAIEQRQSRVDFRSAFFLPERQRAARNFPFRVALFYFCRKLFLILL